MEPSELMKLLSELAQFLTAGGEHVYAATYQAVLVSIQRDIVIYAGCTLIGILFMIVGWRLEVKYHSSKDSKGVGILVGVVSGLIVIIFGISLVSKLFDLQRVDFLTIEALKNLATFITK